PQVLIVEPVEEEPAQVPVLLPPCLAQDRSALVGELSDETASIIRRLVPLDQAAALEPVRQAGEAPGRHEPLPGELRHAHAIATGSAEQRHDAVLGHADAQWSQPGLDLSPDAVVRVEQTLPSSVLQLGQTRSSHSRSLAPPGTRRLSA